MAAVEPTPGEVWEPLDGIRSEEALATARFRVLEVCKRFVWVRGLRSGRRRAIARERFRDPSPYRTGYRVVESGPVDPPSSTEDGP
jgi:hypothetical protein